MESVEDIQLEADDKMQKSMDFLQGELAGLRTGKASPSLVETIDIDYYGTQTKLKQLANIGTPEPRLIVINPYDPSSLQAIEKAILASNIGITPMNDGRVIRIPIPELSEERRKELVKVASRLGEEAKVAIRNVRREANDQIKKLEKGSKISEDERDEALQEVQNYTDNYTRQIDDRVQAKEKDIMTV